MFLLPCQPCGGTAGSDPHERSLRHASGTPHNGIPGMHFAPNGTHIEIGKLSNSPLRDRRLDECSWASGGGFHDRSLRFVYGWRVVAEASLGLCFSTGTIVVLCFGTFFKPLCEYFHATRATVSLAFTLQSLLAAVTMPSIGGLIDRFGARKVILTGSPLLGVILLSLQRFARNTHHVSVRLLHHDRHGGRRTGKFTGSACFLEPCGTFDSSVIPAV